MNDAENSKSNPSKAEGSTQFVYFQFLKKSAGVNLKLWRAIFAFSKLRQQGD
jgi:hypothetical protein